MAFNGSGGAFKQAPPGTQPTSTGRGMYQSSGSPDGLHRQERQTAGGAVAARPPVIGGVNKPANSINQLQINKGGPSQALIDSRGGQYGYDETQARKQQQDALGLQRGAAQGNAPSQAEQLMSRGMDDAVRAQSALAGGARGPGGMASAQRMAGENAAMAQQGITSQMGALRADEMAKARDSYAAGTSQIRGQDQSRLQGERDYTLGQGNIDLGYANVDKGYAELDQRQGMFDDNLAFQYMDYENQVNNATAEGKRVREQEQQKRENEYRRQAIIDWARKNGASQEEIDDQMRIFGVT